MGLFSKLFGGSDKDEQSAMDFLKDLISGSNDSQESQDVQTGQDPEYEEEGESGFSWGPKMPAEENQFNFPGPFIDYFRKVLREDFGSYRLEEAIERDGGLVTFSLYQGERMAAVVEVLPSSCSQRYKVRESCKKQGIPYVRFYHDHEGWWNTRAYVNDRIVKAMQNRLEG